MPEIRHIDPDGGGDYTDLITAWVAMRNFYADQAAWDAGGGLSFVCHKGSTTLGTGAISPATSPTAMPTVTAPVNIYADSGEGILGGRWGDTTEVATLGNIITNTPFIFWGRPGGGEGLQILDIDPNGATVFQANISLAGANSRGIRMGGCHLKTDITDKTPNSGECFQSWQNKDGINPTLLLENNIFEIIGKANAFAGDGADRKSGG